MCEHFRKIPLCPFIQDVEVAGIECREWVCVLILVDSVIIYASWFSSFVETKSSVT